MKPIKLVMEAFGPYKDKVEVDFEKLGDNGIYLITGDTGSGKTTIFDAISFALFGVSSGSRREGVNLRSDFASDDVVTVVELEFMHKNILYKIERRPRYLRKKKNKEGMTTVSGEAVLTYLDEVITGDKSVTDKCVDILGMTADQFRQIVMIAQGEFLELLLAKSKDRATIFRHIFDTGIFKKISDNLKEAYLNKKRQYEDSFLSIKNYIDNIIFENEVDLDKNTDEILKLLETEITKDLESEKIIEEEYNEVFQKSSILGKKLGEAKVLNENIISLKNCQDELKELLLLNDNYKEKESVVLVNKEIWDKIEPCRKEYSRVDKELVIKRKQYNGVKDSYKDILVKYQKSLIENDRSNQYQEEIKRLEKLILETENNLSLVIELGELKTKITELKQIHYSLELNTLESNLEVFEKCKKEEEYLNRLRLDLKSKKDKYMLDNEYYLKQYDLFLSSQAGILAKDLKEGCACPVCGSLNHPKLATIVDEVLSKDELDELKNKLDEVYASLENNRLIILDKEKNLELLKKDIANIDYNKLISDINDLRNKCGNYRSIDIKKYSLNELEIEIASLNISVKEKEEKLSNLVNEAELKNELHKYRQEISLIENNIKVIKENYDKTLKEKVQLESSCELLEKDILNLDKQLILVKEDYKNAYQSLGYSNEEEYLLVRKDKVELEILEKEVLKYREKLSGIKEQIKVLENIVQDRKEVDCSRMEDELKVLNENLDNINMSLKNINNKISNNKKIYDRLKSVSEKTTKLEKEVMIYKDLSDTANGTISGKSKLEFEQFVQASYFDRVLESANKRLLYMTEERFELYRKEEALRLSDRLGLEIEVMDYYTGKKRDVKSLSGGESFKTSLSLALGMSDVIQEFAGGVLVDAMFIDEGFGSLDDESLDQAMDAIMTLSQNDKVIGIISHVNELKSRIDKKIVVSKSNNGSKVEIVI